MMEPLFANSAVVTVPERLVLRRGAHAPLSLGVRYGLFVHPGNGPVLVDTGYGPRAVSAPGRSALLRAYGAVLRPRLVDASAPVAQLAGLGFQPDNVGTIIVTHFHPDHIAGLRDFPKARFLASGRAWAHLKKASPLRRLRAGFFMELLPEDFEQRLEPIEARQPAPLPFGLGFGFDLFGDGTVLSMDLPGHALGHFGLCWPRLDPPLLYGVDAQWLGAALVPERQPRGPARLIYDDARAVAGSAARVADFARAGGRVVLCHEALERET